MRTTPTAQVETGGDIAVCPELSPQECLAQAAMLVETAVEGAIVIGAVAETRGQSGSSRLSELAGRASRALG